MPIATPDQYAQMLSQAKVHGYAYPAINVSSSLTLNAALAGFAGAESNGIIQVTTGGGEFLAGQYRKNKASGALAIAAFATEVAKQYPVLIALHTDHCPEPNRGDFLDPLITASEAQVASGGLPIFQSHMWDGSAMPLNENLVISRGYLERCAAIDIILEIEIGVVGGEEDGIVGAIDEKLYSTPEDALAVVDTLGAGENGRYITALTFGNVHGVYKPGNVKLRPEILKVAQEAASAKLGLPEGSQPFDLVFHGGSGSTPEEIALAVSYGVLKMNLDTDTQYAFTRSIAGWMLSNYDGVLKIDGEVGDKKRYDPRAWGKAAETAMTARVVEACKVLGSAGHKL